MVWFWIIVGCFVFGLLLGIPSAIKNASSEQPRSFTQTTSDVIFGKEPDNYSNSINATTSDWDQICRAAIEKAKSGDSGARTWVTKYIFDKKEEKPPSVADKETLSLTSIKVIEDAVMFLCCLGEKKRKVENVVKDLGTKKKYEKVEDLVKDFYKHS